MTINRGEGYACHIIIYSCSPIHPYRVYDFINTGTYSFRNLKDLYSPEYVDGPRIKNSRKGKGYDTSKPI